jgi:hypothetical protein
MKSQTRVGKTNRKTRDTAAHDSSAGERAVAFTPPDYGIEFVDRGLASGARLAIQRKLTISKPGDEYEHEADRVADQVMRMPDSQMQRACACGGGCPKCQTEQPDLEHERLQAKHVQPNETGQIATPPIVREVLRSPGQPLEPTTRDFMEQRLGHDFGQIRIHTDPDAAKASAALGAEAFTVGHHIAFGRERFLPGTAHGQRLVAHELTHAIQQAATSPHIALSPDKPRASKFDGVVLGTNRNKQDVKVKREVGATQGYDDRRQAIAVARLAKAEPSAVVLGKDEKWHALETTAEFEVGRVSTDPKAAETAASNALFSEVYGLPSLTGIAQSQKTVDDLKAKLASLDAQGSKADPKEREKTVQNLTQANMARAKFILGVPESEIEFTRSLSGRKSGKVNIIGLPEIGSTGGGHAPMGGEAGFEEGRGSAFWIDLPELGKARAAETMFHEVSHLRDWEFAQEWIRKYTTETKRLFVKSAPAPFRDWLNDQAKKDRLTKADVEMVIMEAGDASAYTEARANVRSFLADLQAGAPDLATKGLVGYAHALKPKSQGGGGQYGNPAPKSEVKAALVAELKSAYRQMPKPMQQEYDAAVAAAKKENPSAWISELDFSKRAGR